MELITIEDVVVRVDANGRYCLNDLHKAAIANGKATENHAPAQFLRNDGVQAFIGALDMEKGSVQICTSVNSVKGGKSPGTFAVELVAIRYAAWIDPAFEVRVYRTFQLASKDHSDWRKLRHSAASSSKVQSAMLQEVRQQIGKATQAHHHMNEHKLINSLLTGEYKGLKREDLSAYQLDFLSHFELRNAVLIGMGLTYEQRKGALKAEAMDWAQKQAPSIATIAQPATETAAGV